VAESVRTVAVTPKEREVLDAVAQRLTNAEIASRLYISERTVETHVSSLLRKYQVASRRELIRAAIGEARWQPDGGSLPAMLARSVCTAPHLGGRADDDKKI
jgi:DNA-binding CsgD family transcriptional regulator